MGRFFSVSFSLLVVFLSLSETGADCLPDWSSHEGHCYKVFTQKMTWADAEKFCTEQVKTGHLVSFHSSEEVDFMVSLAFPILKVDFVWIGMSDYLRHCSSHWIDGFFPFYEIIIEYAECFVLDTRTKTMLIAMPCEKTFPFMCKHPVPGKDSAV